MKVAVITPTWNRGDNGLLLKTMKSVSGQTYRDFVHIVVDHGSTDNTPEVFRDYAMHDSRVFYTRIEREPEYDKGSVDGSNHGIRLVLEDPYFSDVKYMAYLHDDDMLPQRSLELRVGAMGLNPRLRMIYGYNGICNESMKLLYVLSGPDIKNPQKLARRLIKSQRTDFPNHTVMLRRDLLKELGGFDNDIFWGDDRDFSIRSLKDLRDDEVLRIPEIVYYFRDHPYNAGKLNPYRKESDLAYLDRKHGRTRADAFIEELHRLRRPHSLLPEAIKAKLRPVRDRLRHNVKTNSFADPYIAAIENGMPLHA